MAKKSIKYNYVYHVFYQILTLLTPLITTPYVSRVLGVEGVGTISYAESIVSYFTMFAAMGIAGFGRREIAYAQGDRQKRSEVFWETKTLSVITTSVTFVVYGVFAMRQENRILYLILAFHLLNVITDVTWLFQGMEEFGVIVLRNIFFKCLNITYVFLMVRSRDDVTVYAFGIAFLDFMGNVSLWRKLGKLVDRPQLRSIHPFRHLLEVFSLFVPSIALSVYTVMDKTMLGVITGSNSENGCYEQALKVSRMVLTVVTSLGTVMAPRVAYHFAKQEMKKVQDYMYKAYRYVWFLGIPLCLGLTGIAANMVPWFYGPGYEKIKYLLPVLSFLILCVGINNITGMQYLIPTRRQNLYTVTVMIGAAVNLLLNLCLIPALASIGAAIASVAAEATIAVVQLIIVRKELSLATVFRFSRNYIAAGLVMETVLLVENRFLDASPVVTAVMILSGAVVYFLVLLLRRDSFFIGQTRNVCDKARNAVHGISNNIRR